MDVWDVIVASALQDNSSSGELVRTCKSSPERATRVPSWTSHRRPTAFTAWERRASLLEAMGLSLRNATCKLSSELQRGDAWSFLIIVIKFNHNL